MTITLGDVILRGSVRSVGETMLMPKPGTLSETDFRQVVIDIDDGSAPLELWLAEEP